MRACPGAWLDTGRTDTRAIEGALAVLTLDLAWLLARPARLLVADRVAAVAAEEGAFAWHLANAVRVLRTTTTAFSCARVTAVQTLIAYDRTERLWVARLRTWHLGMMTARLEMFVDARLAANLFEPHVRDLIVTCHHLRVTTGQLRLDGNSTRSTRVFAQLRARMILQAFGGYASTHFVALRHQMIAIHGMTFQRTCMAALQT